MNREHDSYVLLHGVADLRKGAQGLLNLLDKVESNTWYLFGNRTRTLLKAVKRDHYGYWTSARRFHKGAFHWSEKASGVTLLSFKQVNQLCQQQIIKENPEDFL